MTGKPDAFVALASVSVLNGIDVPIAPVLWTPGRLSAIESALELLCAQSHLQWRTGWRN